MRICAELQLATGLHGSFGQSLAYRRARCWCAAAAR